jgi:phosphatidylglycerophosphatase A
VGAADPESRGAARVTPLVRLAGLIASLGPLGYFPFAAATFASFVLAALYLLAPGDRPLLLDGAITLAVILVGVWAAGVGERLWGHDASRIVVDEAAGMAVTLAGMPGGLEVAALAFLFFRIFDILKPFPARRAESLAGGWGVVMDDVLAGVYAHIAVRIALHFWGGA